MQLDDALRLHILKALQTVEVGVRQVIIQCMVEKHGVRWYANTTLFTDANDYFKHPEFLLKTLEEFNGMPELFVGHYREKYDETAPPPIWMVAETMSLGQWSKLFEALVDQSDRDAITAPLTTAPSGPQLWQSRDGHAFEAVSHA